MFMVATLRRMRRLAQWISVYVIVPIGDPRVHELYGFQRGERDHPFGGGVDFMFDI